LLLVFLLVLNYIYEYIENLYEKKRISLELDEVTNLFIKEKEKNKKDFYQRKIGDLLIDEKGRRKENKEMNYKAVVFVVIFVFAFWFLRG